MLIGIQGERLLTSKVRIMGLLVNGTRNHFRFIKRRLQDAMTDVLVEVIEFIGRLDVTIMDGRMFTKLGKSFESTLPLLSCG